MFKEQSYEKKNQFQLINLLRIAFHYEIVFIEGKSTSK